MLNKPAVQIGELTERITLQSFSTSQSGSGHETVTYSDLATVWAKAEVKLSSSDEMQLANKKTAITQTLFTIRNEYAITEKMRVLYKGVAHDITAVNPLPDRQYMILETEKRV